MMRCSLLKTILLCLLIAPAFAVEQGLINDFEDGLTGGWQEGPPSPNPPVNIADGGDMGDGDNFLSNTSAGNGAGSRQKMFNSTPEWTGNYLEAGISGIRMNIANFSDQAVPIRVAFQDFKIYCWSTEAVMVPPGGQWNTYEFSIAEEDMFDVFGFDSYENNFSDIDEVVILSSEIPDCFADDIDVTIGYDDIETTLDDTPDSDTDLVPDDIDNCTLVFNPEQNDADGDGHGNLCDADIDQDCGPVNFADLQLMAEGFFTEDPILDLDSSGGPINFADLSILADLFFQVPGPSAPGAFCNTP